MKWEEKDINQLRELAKDHYTLEIASIMNTTEGSIRSAAKRYNITLLIDNRNKWSEEKKQEFINLAKTHTAYELADYYNVSYSSVWIMAKRLKIEIMKETIWTKEREEELINLCKTYPLAQVAKIMNLDYALLYSKAQRMKLQLLDNNHYWSEEDINYLKENWGQITLERLSKNLKRSKAAVIHKAKVLKLGAMIDSDYSVLKIEDICQIMGVERHTVTTYWQRLGLVVNSKRITKKTSYYYVEWDDLISFLEAHQDIWDSRRIDLYMLGEESEWLKNKRKLDEKRPKMTKKEYEAKEDILILKLVKQGKSYQEIAKLLDRTPGAIETRVYFLGFNKGTINELTNDHIDYIKKRSLTKNKGVK